MTIESAIALAIATIILGLSPGPAVFATIGRALGTGLSRTSLFIAGIILGDVLFSFLAMAGLSVLAMVYAPILTVLRIAGGGYLIYLGVCFWRASNSINLTLDAPEKGWKIALSGFLLTASNPKDLLFFISFLPMFIDIKTVNSVTIMQASCVIAASFTLTLGFYALLANGVRAWFESSNAVSLLHRVASVLMVAVGLSIIFLKS